MILRLSGRFADLPNHARQRPVIAPGRFLQALIQIRLESDGHLFAFVRHQEVSPSLRKASLEVATPATHRLQTTRATVARVAMIGADLSYEVAPRWSNLLI
jgi:hypothetical protein